MDDTATTTTVIYFTGVVNYKDYDRWTSLSLPELEKGWLIPNTEGNWVVTGEWTVVMGYDCGTAGVFHVTDSIPWLEQLRPLAAIFRPATPSDSI